MTDKQIRPPYEIALMHDHILRLEEELKAKEQECERLNKWLPIVTRLEEQFKSHEKAKGINYKTYAEQVFTELNQLKEENEHLSEKEEEARHYLEEAQIYKQALTEIRQLLEDALDSDKTSAEQSFDNLYEALEKCKVIDD